MVTCHPTSHAYDQSCDSHPRCTVHLSHEVSSALRKSSVACHRSDLRLFLAARIASLLSPLSHFPPPGTADATAPSPSRARATLARTPRPCHVSGQRSTPAWARRCRYRAQHLHQLGCRAAARAPQPGLHNAQGCAGAGCRLAGCARPGSHPIQTRHRTPAGRHRRLPCRQRGASGGRRWRRIRPVERPAHHQERRDVVDRSRRDLVRLAQSAGLRQWPGHLRHRHHRQGQVLQPVDPRRRHCQERHRGRRQDRRPRWQHAHRGTECRQGQLVGSGLSQRHQGPEPARATAAADR